MKTNEKKVSEEASVQTTTEKKQKPSATYTLKQFGEIVFKLRELELINREDGDTMLQIRERAKEEFFKKL